MNVWAFGFCSKKKKVLLEIKNPSFTQSVKVQATVFFLDASEASKDHRTALRNARILQNDYYEEEEEIVYGAGIAEWVRSFFFIILRKKTKLDFLETTFFDTFDLIWKLMNRLTWNFDSSFFKCVSIVWTTIMNKYCYLTKLWTI